MPCVWRKLLAFLEVEQLFGESSGGIHEHPQSGRSTYLLFLLTLTHSFGVKKSS